MQKEENGIEKKSSKVSYGGRKISLQTSMNRYNKLCHLKNLANEGDLRRKISISDIINYSIDNIGEEDIPKMQESSMSLEEKIRAKKQVELDNYNKKNNTNYNLLEYEAIKYKVQ